MKTLLAVLFSSFFFGQLFSQDPDLEIPCYPNEVIDFTVKYGIFKVGEARLEFCYNNKCPGAYIQANAKSSGILKLITDFHFRYTCCMDTATGLPFTDSRILKQGSYIDTCTVYYDRISRKDSTLVYSKKTDTIVCPKSIYDLMSGFYLYRANYLRDNLPLNHSVTTTTFFINEIWDLTIKYCGKETKDTKYGTVECLKIKPVTIIGPFFETDHAMSLWIANNRNYVPVEFATELKLGTLRGYITGYKISQPQHTKSIFIQGN